MYNSLPHKTKQFFWLLIKLSIVIGCGYFIYQRLLENKELDIKVFYQKVIENDVFALKNLSFLLFLTFLNWFLEVLKWQNLVSFIKQISLLTALKQSLAAHTTSLITPNKIGEYGAKVMFFKPLQRKTIVGLNLVGNFYQLTATLFFGFLGFGYFVFQHNVEIDFHRIFRGFLLFVILIATFLLGTKHFNRKNYRVTKAKQFIGKISIGINLKTVGLSFLRYLIFSHQFYVLLLIFNIKIGYINALSAIVSVYFVASFVPMLTLFDVVLKSTVAVWVFSYFRVNVVSILSITSLLWLLNFVLPALIGSYFVLTFKPIASK